MKKQSLIIKVHDIKDLVTPPQQDYFSNYEYIQAGEAALAHTIQYINPNKSKNISHLDICVPTETITTANVTNVRHLIHHFLKFHIKDNNEKMLLFKRNTTRIFWNALLFLTLCMGIVTLLGAESFIPNLPPLMRSVLVEGFTVVGWVIMWRPIELVLNQWTLLKLENKLYQNLLKADISVSSDIN